MKKIVLSFLFLFMSVNFVSAEYVRKLKEPEFFIPYNDRMHKEENLPYLKKHEISKTKTQKIKEENKKIVFEESPEYKKISEEYFKSINDYALNKKFDKNIKLEEDLSSMNSYDVFEVSDDNSSKITTKEQYEFYMLAKKILDN